MMTRKADDLLLHQMDMAQRGVALTEIARITKTPLRTLRERIARVRDEDCRHDPEAAYYWHQPEEGNPA